MARNRACVLLEMRLIRQREIWEEVREDRVEDMDRWADLTDGEERLEEVYLRSELTGGADGNGRAWNPDMQDYKAESQGSSRYGCSNAQQSPVLYGSTTGTKAGGIVMIAAGGSMALIFLILFLASCIASLPESPGALWIMRAVFGLLTAASGMITGWGIKLLKQVGRFKNYSRRIAGREYCNISEIGSNSGKSIKFVTKDLERMISKGWFRQGHMDGEEMPDPVKPLT